MTIKELGEKGYEFRQRSTPNYGACVALCHAGRLVDIFYASSTRFAKNAARKRAIAHFVEKRLS